MDWVGQSFTVYPERSIGVPYLLFKNGSKNHALLLYLCPPPLLLLVPCWRKGGAPPTERGGGPEPQPSVAASSPSEDTDVPTLGSPGSPDPDPVRGLQPALPLQAQWAPPRGLPSLYLVALATSASLMNVPCGHVSY